MGWLLSYFNFLLYFFFRKAKKVLQMMASSNIEFSLESTYLVLHLPNLKTRNKFTKVILQKTKEIDKKTSTRSKHLHIASLFQWN